MPNRTSNPKTFIASGRRYRIVAIRDTESGVRHAFTDHIPKRSPSNYSMTHARLPDGRWAIGVYPSSYRPSAQRKIKR